MNRRRLAGARAAAVMAVMAAVSFPIAAGAQTRQFPETRSASRVFADQFQSSLSDEQIAFAARKFAGCQKIPRADVRRLRAVNPDFLVLHYQLGCGNGPEYFLDGDDWTSDWAYVTTQEGWFMHQGGSRLHMGAWNWYLMDVSSSAYRSYWAQSCIERMRHAECDGVFADSLTADAYFDALSPPHPWFSDPAECLSNWVPRLEAYAASILAALAAAPERFYFIPNLGGLVTGWDTTDYGGLGDGGMVEGFGILGPDSYFDPADWRLQMERVLSLARRDKVILLQSYTSDAAMRERMFLAGCVLLVKGARTYSVMLGDSGSDLAWYPEYDIPLGAYVGEIPSGIAALFDASSGCYRREYANGFVLVNPGESDSGGIELGGTFILVSASGGGPVDEHGAHGGSLSYRETSRVTVPGRGAAILLREVPPSSHALSLRLDRTAFATTDSLSLGWDIVSGPAGSPATGDAWSGVSTPWGGFYFYDGSFSTRPRPIASFWGVRTVSGELGPFPLAGLSSGAYTWYAVLTLPGRDPRDASAWISTLGSAGFRIE